MAGNAGIAFGPLATTASLVVLDWRTVVVALAIPALVGAVLALWAAFDETAVVEADSASGTDPADGADLADGTDSTDGADPTDSPDETDGVPGGVSSLPEFLAGTRTLFVGAFVLVFLVMVSAVLTYGSTRLVIP